MHNFLFWLCERKMESLLHSTSATYLVPKFPKLITYNQNSCLAFARNSVIVGAKRSNKKKNNNDNNKEDSHSFFSKADEDNLFFPEAVLLKEKKVQEDGRALPEFADDEEEKLYESLNIELESELNVERRRHYEVVYLIHEKYEEDVGSVNEKVQDFLREKKGRVWRLNDWGLRRLAYEIQKAKKAHYILMNFELEAKWINDFKTMLDKDEKVIRHLVIKRDKAITEDCPPPPEFHTLRAEMHGYDEEEDDIDYDDEEYDDEYDDGEGDEMDDNDDDDFEHGFSVVNVDDNEGEHSNDRSANISTIGRSNLRAEKVSR